MFDVTVLLNMNPEAMFPGRGYDASDRMQEVCTFHIEAETPEAACEVVFAICNSYPTELHCDPKYSKLVRAYRHHGSRSLSVGDLCMIDGRSYQCASVGWALVES